jgi:stage III sporulation protein AA
MTEAILTESELTAILTRMCGGSLYAYSQTIHEGYITLPDGIRVGVAGRAVCEGGRVIGVCEITGLCIRLPHRYGHMGGMVCRLLRSLNNGRASPQGILLYAPPGEGKTTLLRAVAAGLAGADGGTPLRTVVVDTRGELGFETDGRGLCLDILRGYPRARGVEIATRTLSAQVIVCDEIGDTEEAMSLISSHHGGVPLVASAHGGTVEEILRRTGLRLLHEARLFGAYVGIRRDGHGDFTYRVTPHADADRIALGRDTEGMALPVGGGA